MIVRAISVGFLIAAAEVLNGNLRVRYLQRRFGRQRGQLVSFFTGVSLFLVIIGSLLDWVGPGTISDCLIIGLIWSTMLTALDLYVGRFVFRLSWAKVGEDFNPLRGKFLSIGLLLLFCAPSLFFIFR